MAEADTLNDLKLAIQALSEKYDVSQYAIRSILAEIPDTVLKAIDWKDLDAVVQEGLEEDQYEEEEEEVTSPYNFTVGKGFRAMSSFPKEFEDED
jgi:hypothetical protein